MNPHAGLLLIQPTWRWITRTSPRFGRLSQRLRRLSVNIGLWLVATLATDLPAGAELNHFYWSALRPRCKPETRFLLPCEPGLVEM